MPTPHPPRPPYPPPGGEPGQSDDDLASLLRGRPDGVAARAAALLMARHWQPVHDYASICLAARTDLASMAAAAAFHHVLDRLALGEPATALRPRLLVRVRDTVREWAGDDRVAEVMPDLDRPGGGRGMRAAKSMTPENRRLAEHAFQGLPGRFRCLLWHTEVEGEGLSVPAGLLGMDLDTAEVTLDQARDKFREGCVHAHRDLAPSQDCRYYNRLLDVPIRRGGTLLPDVRRHLDGCRHCRHAAEQLGQFDGPLGPLLAESVLGWGGRRYLETRRSPDQQGRHGRGRHGRGRRRLLPGIPAPRDMLSGQRSNRALVTGVGLAFAGLIAGLLAGGVGSDGGSAPAASTGALGGSPSVSGGVADASPGTTQLPSVPRQSRMRNVAADLCLDVRGHLREGAGAALRACSDADSQKWTYESDGRLHSEADPRLCLDSRADAGVVILNTCAKPDGKRAGDVRYDITTEGEFLTRWDRQLALTAAADEAGADIVVKVRNGTDEQRWVTDPRPQDTEGVAGTGGTDAPDPRSVGGPA